MRYIILTALLLTTARLAAADCQVSLTNVAFHKATVAMWKFDGSNPRVLLDVTEQHVGLVRNGTALTRQGVSGQSDRGGLEFDGKSGHVVVRHDKDLLLDQGTIACWLRVADTERTQGIISKDANGFGDGGHITLSIQSGNVVMRLQSSTASHEIRGAIKADRSTHVAATFGVAGMQLFVDGKLVDSNGYRGGLGKSSGGEGNHEPLVIGASTINSNSVTEFPLTDFLGGQVDEVSIVREQLTAEAISQLISAATPVYASLPQAYVANDPLAWWRLDEAADESEAVDKVGQQHGSYNIVGDSHFDGDDFVDVGALDLADSTFTIAAKITPASFTVSDARIIAKENGLDEENHFWTLATTIKDDQTRLRFRLTTKDGTRDAVANQRLEIGQIYCVQATYDGRKMRIYQNGEMVADIKQSGHPNTNSHCHAWIGDTPAGAGERPFDGKIEDVAIFNEAISIDDAKAIAVVCPACQSQTSDQVASDAEPTEPVPEVLPSGDVPEPPQLVTPPTPAPPVDARPLVQFEPYVPRCPLCGELGHHGPIRRVSLDGPATSLHCRTCTE